MLPYTQILFKPGSKFSYSNPAVIFLGKIIEKLSGDDYEVYIDKNILKPLEMYRTYFDATPYHLLKYRSASYYIENGKRTEGRFDANTGITVSNSGLNSPLPDMEKYLNFLIGVRTGSDSDRVPYDTILKRSSLEEMWQPQVKTEVDANGNRGFTTDVGLIFFLNRHREPEHFSATAAIRMVSSATSISTRKNEPPRSSCFNTNVILPENAAPEKDVVGNLRRAVRKLHEMVR